VSSILGLVRNGNPVTSTKAAHKAVRGTKRGAIRGQLLALLSTNGPLTSKELAHLYQQTFDLGVVVDLPPADEAYVRRVLTEMKRKHGTVEPSGDVRDDCDVMRLVVSS
jgi:hypothetical protein